MSRTATVSAPHAHGLWARFVAAFDRTLMGMAQISRRNDEPPYFGL